MLGRWDEVLAVRDEFTQEQIDAGGVVLSLLQAALEVYVHRGELDKARRLFGQFARLEDSTNVQDRGTYLAVTAALRRGEGRLEDALAAGSETIEVASTLGASFQGVKHGVLDALEAASALGNAAKVEELLAFIDDLSAGARPPYLDAHARRVRARLARDAEGFQEAARRFRELETPFWLAVTLLEHAELSGDEASLGEAREIFERLEATPWLERAAAAQPVTA
jgi:hypothetical protein